MSTAQTTGTMTAADVRLDCINSWTRGKEGTVTVYTNPEGWTIGKGRKDNGWTIRNPHGASRRETYRSVLAAQLRVADYMGI